MYRDYSPKGVRFYFIYKALAHPETNGYVQPVSLEERLLHIAEAKAKLGSQIPWLCDTMKNNALHALGNAPNSEFIIDPQGRVVVRRVWSRPDELRKDLEKLVGAVERPTKVEDLQIKPYFRPSRQDAPIAKLELPANLRPLQVRTSLSTEPYYAKLRAEAEPAVLEGSPGKIYLGFRFDPLYHVHWNNLAGPFEFAISDQQNVQIEPAKGTGPKLEAETDSAPREFLLQVTPKGGPGKGSFQVVVRYFACHGTDGWCKPFTHTYHVKLEWDRDGGRVMRRGESMRGGPMAGRGGPPFRGNRGRAGRIMGVVRRFDGETGKLTVRTRGGETRVFTVTDQTRIMRRGEGRPERTDRKSLAAGARVMLQPESGSDKRAPRVVRMMILPGR